jgi:putative lipoic acid-binding regulatory protein
MTPSIEETLATLKAQHSFPGPFMFKAIGAHADAFASAVIAAVHDIIGHHVTPHVTTRVSSGGRHMAVTLVVHVTSAQQVLDVYTRLGKVAGMKMVM